MRSPASVRPQARLHAACHVRLRMRVHRATVSVPHLPCGAQALPQGEAQARDYDDSLLRWRLLRVPARRQRRCPTPGRHQGVVYDPVGAERIARLDELFLPEWGQKRRTSPPTIPAAPPAQALRSSAKSRFFASPTVRAGAGIEPFGEDMHVFMRAVRPRPGLRRRAASA